MADAPAASVKTAFYEVRVMAEEPVEGQEEGSVVVEAYSSRLVASSDSE